MKLRKDVLVLFLGTYMLNACGSAPIAGGSTNGSGSPNVSFSANTLTFGNVVVDAASPSQQVTLTNSGSATLNIASIAASENFAETNDCGPTLAAGANCAINVIFTPSTTGDLSGMLSVSDGAPGSPQTVALSGSGEPTAAKDTLTGYCWGAVRRGAPQECGTAPDPTQCPVGQPAITPVTAGGCRPPQSAYVDTSRGCQAETSTGMLVQGECVVTYGGASASATAGIEPR